MPSWLWPVTTQTAPFGSTWNDALWTMSLILLVISVSFVMLVRRLQGKRRWL